jgi:hypothetical protein
MGDFRQYLLMGLLLVCGQPLLAQMNKTWFSAMDKTLKGKVKTWTMRNEKGMVRQHQYNSSGQLLSDTYKETPQTYMPPEMLPDHYKKQHEKKYSTALSRKEPGFETQYNDQFQLIEKSVTSRLWIAWAVPPATANWFISLPIASTKQVKLCPTMFGKKFGTMLPPIPVDRFGRPGAIRLWCIRCCGTATTLRAKSPSFKTMQIMRSITYVSYITTMPTTI